MVWSLGLIVALVDLGAGAGFFHQLHLGLKEVHVQPQVDIQIGQSGEFGVSVDALIDVKAVFNPL